MENLLRRDEVLDLLGISKSTLYRWIDDGRLPEPIRLGPNVPAWREGDLRDWLDSRPVGRGDQGAA